MGVGLGATNEVVEESVKVIQSKFPDIHIAGFNHGYFWEDEEHVVKKIAESGTKLLFVAITSPAKEIFINRWRNDLHVNFVMGVGGSFDIIAGKVKRAPIWMQRAGLEWIYRVIQEPGRLCGRYLKTNTKFLFLLLGYFIAALRKNN